MPFLIDPRLKDYKLCFKTLTKLLIVCVYLLLFFLISHLTGHLELGVSYLGDIKFA